MKRVRMARWRHRPPCRGQGNSDHGCSFTVVLRPASSRTIMVDEPANEGSETHPHSALPHLTINSGQAEAVPTWGKFGRALANIVASLAGLGPGSTRIGQRRPTCGRHRPMLVEICQVWATFCPASTTIWPNLGKFGRIRAGPRLRGRLFDTCFARHSSKHIAQRLRYSLEPPEFRNRAPISYPPPPPGALKGPS